MVKISLFSRFNAIWKTLFVLMFVFLFFPIRFLFQTLRTTSLKLGFENLNIDRGQQEYEKDWTFFRLAKHVKPICKLIFPKCLVVLGKGCTWQKRESKFYVWTYFTIHLTLCLIFIKVCPKEDASFEAINWKLYLLPKSTNDYQMYLEYQSYQIVGCLQKKYPNFQTAIYNP